jgi:CRISPR-associated exonuclease Cas4
MNYEEEDFLQISGIQHFAFCQRQWALIRIEGVWTENYLTAQGRLLHDKADDPWFNEIRKGMIVSRSMPLVSQRLGLQGVADIVELRKNENGVTLSGRSGRWKLQPVEYKRGKPKDDHCDELQLCAQAMCLEEMLSATIPSGEIFYGQIRRRTPVEFTDALRDEVVDATARMHEMYAAGTIPLAKKEKKCNSCSLLNDCNPELFVVRDKVNLYVEKELFSE